MMMFALGNVSKNVDYWIHGGQSCTFSFMSHLSIRFARKASQHLRGMSHSVRGGKSIDRLNEQRARMASHSTAPLPTALLLDP
jgi:hypothetical protein